MSGGLRERPWGSSFHQHEIKTNADYCGSENRLHRVPIELVGKGIRLCITKIRWHCPSASLFVSYSYLPLYQVVIQTPGICTSQLSTWTFLLLPKLPYTQGHQTAKRLAMGRGRPLQSLKCCRSSPQEGPGLSHDLRNKATDSIRQPEIPKFVQK